MKRFFHLCSDFWNFHPVLQILRLQTTPFGFGSPQVFGLFKALAVGIAASVSPSASAIKTKGQEFYEEEANTKKSRFPQSYPCCAHDQTLHRSKQSNCLTFPPRKRRLHTLSKPTCVRRASKTSVETRQILLVSLAALPSSPGGQDIC